MPPKQNVDHVSHNTCQRLLNRNIGFHEDNVQDCYLNQCISLQERCVWLDQNCLLEHDFPAKSSEVLDFKRKFILKAELRKK